MLRETTSRGLCGLVCPSRTSERGGKGYCVKGGGLASLRRRGACEGRSTPFEVCHGVFIWREKQECPDEPSGVFVCSLLQY